MLPIESLQKLSQNISETNTGELSLSIYSGKLSTKVIIDNVKKIKQAFPSLPNGFYDILSDRLKNCNFSDERINDAVNNVIDNCVYPQPTIAQFISFDRRIKLYTYEEMINKVNGFGVKVWEDYQSVKFPDRDKPVWVSIDDIKKYHLK